MLIYNYQKEFIGISEKDLHTFGFTDLAELRSESADFADMFVKVPGFIHNFKHVHWIDFILSSDSYESAQAVIHAKSKNYQCSLSVETIYLTDEPSSKSYMVHMSNIMQTTDERVQDASANIVKKPAQTPPVQTPIETPQIQAEPVVQPVIEDTTPPQQPQATIPTAQPVAQPVIDDKPIDISFDEPEIQQPKPVKKQQTAPKVEPLKQAEGAFDNGYVYDPKVASDELGLPLDLIEEFIEDFIAQAYEFKGGMYNALEQRDSDTLKILSHKLKGVAANLRIEDACETLTIINASNDENEIRSQLDTLYKITNKLANKPAPQEEVEPESSDHDDDIDLDIFIQKDDPVTPSSPPVKPAQEKETIAIDLPVVEEEKETIAIDLPVVEDEVEKTPQKENEEVVTITYDKQKVANEIGMTADEFTLIFNDYAKESQELVSAIKSAIASSDLRQVNRKAMQLKGMNDNMRVDDCKDELAQLQTTQDLEVAKQLSQKIEAVMQQISNIKG